MLTAYISMKWIFQYVLYSSNTLIPFEYNASNFCTILSKTQQFNVYPSYMSLPIVRYNNKYYPEFKYVNTNMSMRIDLVKC